MKATTIKTMTGYITDTGIITINNDDKANAYNAVNTFAERNNLADMRNSDTARAQRATVFAIVSALSRITNGIASGKADASRMLKAGELAYAVVPRNIMTTGTDEAANDKLKADAKRAGITDGTVRHMAYPQDKSLRVIYRSLK